MTAELCPALPLGEWKDTYATLHMWTQIVGKIRLVQSPMVNHWWHSTLYVTSHGLGTSPIPYRNRIFEIDFNFTDHKLVIHTSDGVTRALLLAPRSVADFYGELTAILRSLAIEIEIHSKPDEVPNPIPFAKDHEHASYDAEYANRFWRILAQADRVLKEFRSRFIGKCSPVHFFWGSFDLAVTRFSGRPAPEHPGGVPNLPDSVTREAYSHEVSSCGFWPGGGAIIEPAFYSYAYPEPRGFKDYPVQPKAAFYSPDMGEFILPYNAVRQADNPDEVLLEFLQSTYEATANSGNWDRAALERTAVGQKQK